MEEIDTPCQTEHSTVPEIIQLRCQKMKSYGPSSRSTSLTRTGHYFPESTEFFGDEEMINAPKNNPEGTGRSPDEVAITKKINRKAVALYVGGSKAGPWSMPLKNWAWM